MYEIRQIHRYSVPFDATRRQSGVCLLQLTLRCNTCYWLPPQWAATPPSVCRLPSSPSERLQSLPRGSRFFALPRLQVALCNAVTANRLNPRPPARLTSVGAGASAGSTLWLQIQHNDSPSHKPGLHGGLEAFGATFCPICLQTPEEAYGRMFIHPASIEVTNVTAVLIKVRQRMATTL